MLPYATIVPKHMHFRSILGAEYDPQWDYQLVFPSSLPTKRRDGWTLVREDVEEILGQSLYLIGRPQQE